MLDARRSSWRRSRFSASPPNARRSRSLVASTQKRTWKPSWVTKSFLAAYPKMFSASRRENANSTCMLDSFGSHLRDRIEKIKKLAISKKLVRCGPRRVWAWFVSTNVLSIIFDHMFPAKAQGLSNTLHSYGALYDSHDKVFSSFSLFLGSLCHLPGCANMILMSSSTGWMWEPLELSPVKT